MDGLLLWISHPSFLQQAPNAMAHSVELVWKLELRLRTNLWKWEYWTWIGSVWPHAYVSIPGSMRVVAILNGSTHSDDWSRVVGWTPLPFPLKRGTFVLQRWSSFLV